MKKEAQRKREEEDKKENGEALDADALSVVEIVGNFMLFFLLVPTIL